MDLRGLYKISGGLLTRMVSKRVMSGPKEFNGASRHEILSILYMTHIADSRGRIEGFRVSGLMSKIGCSRRKAFDLMHTLCDKGFIRILPSEWAGCHDIELMYSDFSKYDKSMRYLDTNRDMFEQGRELYDIFSSMSLYSMRLLLYVMYNYSEDYGYHVSLESAMQALGIKHRYVLVRCLDEIRDSLGFIEEVARIRKNLKTGMRYGYMDFAKRLMCMKKSEGITWEKDSFYKRHVELMADDLGASLPAEPKRRGYILGAIFSICQSVSEKLPLERIEQCLRSVFLTDGILDELTVRHFSDSIALLQT